MLFTASSPRLLRELHCKSQLAIDATSFEQDVRANLDLLKVPGRRCPEAEIFQLLRERLYDASKSPWLLNLDDLDYARFLLEDLSTARKIKATFWNRRKARNGPKDERYPDYLPTCAHGSILFTNRSRSAALQVVEQTKYHKIRVNE
ncbi:hypothetical protein LTR49_011383 [Elasticomyces elasticus]|nr:hypothetical protein LTR49_011383 [Elasticomyces elasticus]KAK5761913.1 hypothetical protein LTS12_007976 [Elasticomyces elasticus]